MAGSGDLALELRRILPAPPSVVFAAFTDPQKLARWWGPRGFTTPSLQIDPRVGATYRIEMQPPAGNPFYVTGEFREVDPPNHLTFTFVWEDPDPDDVDTLVDLSLRDLDATTEVTLDQGRFTTEARRELHRSGWMDSFDKLEQLVSARS